MRNLLIGFSLFFASFSANAVVDTICYLDDCFQYGWESFDLDNGNTDRFFCVDNNCNLGWTITKFDGKQQRAKCLKGGCLVDGYDLVEVNPGGESVISRTVCKGMGRSRSCPDNGWTTTIKATKQNQFTTCTGNSCRTNGWTTTDRSGQVLSTTQCKNASCFGDGYLSF